MNWAKIEEITYSECDNPHELLGPHKQGSKMLVQAFFPGAEKVTIHWKKTGQVGEAFLAYPWNWQMRRAILPHW